MITMLVYVCFVYPSIPYCIILSVLCYISIILNNDLFSKKIQISISKSNTNIHPRQ